MMRGSRLFPQALWLSAVLLAVYSASAPAEETSTPQCAPMDDPAAALLEAHERARQAHLEGNVELMTEDWAPRTVSVQDGELTVDDSAESAASFAEYFAGVSYSEWRDIVPPIVRVSPDGQMGWMAVRIAMTVAPRSDPAAEQRFTSSWIATYEVQDCRWRMTGIASEVVEAE